MSNYYPAMVNGSVNALIDRSGKMIVAALPIPARAKVISVNTAPGASVPIPGQDSTNPIYVGDQPSLVVGTGFGTTSTPYTIKFTRPDGTAYFGTPSAIYDSQQLPVLTGAGEFGPSTYVIYNFSAGEINQFGVWGVVVTCGNTSSGLGKFTVSPGP